jgi:hypothetical protein
MSNAGTGVVGIEEVAIEPEAYHTDPAFADRLSNSKLKDFADDPEVFYDRHVARTIPGKDISSFIFGRRFEALVFYDEAPNVVVIPEGVLQRRRKPNSDDYTFAKAGDTWNAWREEQIDRHGPDVALLKQDEFDKQITPLFLARDRVRQHEAAAKLLWGGTDSRTHVTYRWNQRVGDIEVPSKCQLDVLHHEHVIVDLKTGAPNHVKDADSFARHVCQMRYHWQRYWYRHAVYAATGELMPFRFVAVSSSYPFHVGVYDLDDDGPPGGDELSWEDAADGAVWRELDWYRTCLTTGMWKPRGWGCVAKVKMPRWAQAIEIERSL